MRCLETCTVGPWMDTLAQATDRREDIFHQRELERGVEDFAKLRLKKDGKVTRNDVWRDGSHREETATHNGFRIQAHNWSEGSGDRYSHGSSLTICDRFGRTVYEQHGSSAPKFNVHSTEWSSDFYGLPVRSHEISQELRELCST